MLRHRQHAANQARDVQNDVFPGESAGLHGTNAIRIAQDGSRTVRNVIWGEVNASFYAAFPVCVVPGAACDVQNAFCDVANASSAVKVRVSGGIFM